MPKRLDPIHPGELLLLEFLEPMGVSQNRLARDIDVPVSRIAGIIKGERAITADTAMRLGAFFGVSPRMWLNLQTAYDLEVAELSMLSTAKQRIRPYKVA